MRQIKSCNGFGNACIVAKQVLQANQGTRFVQITVGGWDMHQDIYGVNNPKGTNIFTLGKALDDGYSALLADLKATGLLNETLVVMSGEFGRTVGKLVSGTRVVTESGDKPTTLQILQRTLSRMVPFEGESAGRKRAPPCSGVSRRSSDAAVAR